VGTGSERGADRRGDSPRPLASADHLGSDESGRHGCGHYRRSGHDGEIFRAYVEQVLCPRLRPGDVVVMDNLSAHKVRGIRERIEAQGAELLYLPPYSPDLNPIEKAWFKLKHFLRGAKARTADGLDQAITEALKQLPQRTLPPGSATADMHYRIN